MPVKFRQTGLPSPLDETRKDCTAFSGELPVGFIYYEVREGGGGEAHVSHRRCFNLHR